MEKGIFSSLIIVNMLDSSKMAKLWAWELTTSMTKLSAQGTGSMENLKKLQILVRFKVKMKSVEIQFNTI